MRISDWSSDVCSSDLLRFALDARLLEVPHAGEHARDEYWRQAGREDETRRIAADHVDDVPVGSDIAAHHAERLTQRALDDVDAVRRLVAVGDAAAARAVHPDGMDLGANGDGGVFRAEEPPVGEGGVS